MMHWLEMFLDRITMYRLVRNTLMVYLLYAALLGFFGVLSFRGVEVLLSTAFLVCVAWAVNRVFAWAFGAPRHTESALITGLILALIITPARTVGDIPVLFFVASIAIASKYMIAVRKQHIFNPVAFGVVATSFLFQGTASWWVGTTWMLPVVAVGGFIIVKKIRRWDTVLWFLATAVVLLVLFALTRGAEFLVTLQRLATISPLLFFASIMFTEPLTMPPTRHMRIAFGIVTGALYLPQLHIGSVYSSPELALVLSNLIFFLLTQRRRVMLQLKEKIAVAPDVMDFVFTGPALAYMPGQYMEWTLPHTGADKRGIRRYLTVASSPTETDVRLGVKFYENGSTFKKHLAAMQPGEYIVASQKDGDFMLPHDVQQPCVFIAGGIGITPFRSMMKYLLDVQERRPIVLFSAQKTAADIVYKDVFDAAQKKLGIATYYLLDAEDHMPKGPQYLAGRLTPELLRAMIPNTAQCIYYLSGPQGMVDAYKTLLRGMGIPGKHIKTDYFPGFA